MNLCIFCRKPIEYKSTLHTYHHRCYRKNVGLVPKDSNCLICRRTPNGFYVSFSSVTRTFCMPCWLNAGGNEWYTGDAGSRIFSADKYHLWWHTISAFFCKESTFDVDAPTFHKECYFANVDRVSECADCNDYDPELMQLNFFIERFTEGIQRSECYIYCHNCWKEKGGHLWFICPTGEESSLHVSLYAQDFLWWKNKWVAVCFVKRANRLMTSAGFIPNAS